jgi:iron complex outermembrane receptor protein
MRRRLLTFMLAVGLPVAAGAQQPAQDDEGVVRLRVPTITVTAEKEPEDAQKAPVSVTAVTRETIEASGVRTVSDAADYAPNTYFHEFGARKLSNPRVRGVGAGPLNPGVTTYVDGVPQLTANTSSTELADVERIEFVRGPQSALYGRNSLGGVINIVSTRPSVTGWSGSALAPFGNFGTADVRASVSGPAAGGRFAIGLSGGFARRDGYTENAVTGNDLDSRSATFGKAQVLWTPDASWEARFLLSGERARDGDYALHDLGALRAQPFVAARDFEGFTERDILAPTVIVRRTGPRVEFSSTTGFVSWETSDRTDLDYSPLPLVTRANDEQSLQFTQEFRAASARDAAIAVAGNVTMSWQAGLFVFTQNYDQEALNTFSPFVLSPMIPFETVARSPLAELDDTGFGVYGRGTFHFGSRFEGAVGLRADRENKQALLETSYAPMIAPPVVVDEEKSFSDVSPQFTAAYHVSPTQMIYGIAARGFKAGGFNAASPAGSESYDPEQSWNYELGVKMLLGSSRVSLNGSLFFIDWDDLQVYLPNPFVPAQFFVDNAGTATSKGAEIELNARVLQDCDFFAGFGYTNARFGAGSVSGRLDVTGHRLPNTPDYTANVGGQYSMAFTSAVSGYARAEIVFRGDYFYDDSNVEGQDAYALTDFRFGARGRRLFAEAWIRNAFDTTYIPTAIAYPDLAPSGYLGEMGAPRTFGVRAGVTF